VAAKPSREKKHGSENRSLALAAPPLPKFNVAEAAHYLRLSASTLRTRVWRRRVGLPTIRCGRRIIFDREALDAWLARRAEK